MFGGVWVIAKKTTSFEHIEKTKGDYPSSMKILLGCGATAEIIHKAGLTYNQQPSNLGKILSCLVLMFASIFKQSPNFSPEVPFSDIAGFESPPKSEKLVTRIQIPNEREKERR
jgi:hypothetical protein